MSNLHTNSVPIVTPEMINTWHKAGLVALTNHVCVQASPSVFSNPHAIRIWRHPHPPEIGRFVAAALEVFGRKNAAILHGVFNKYGYIGLNANGELTQHVNDTIKKRPIEVEDIIKAYDNPRMDRELTSFFAQYRLDCLQQVLSNMGETTLVKIDYFKNEVYSSESGLYKTPHNDTTVMLAFVDSDPGTPYIFESANPDVLFRTTALDVVLHTTTVRHAFATTPRSINGQRKPRQFQSFQLFPEGIPK